MPILAKPDDLVHVLELFFAWQPPVFDQWEKAVSEFKQRVPELGKNFAKLIQKERADQSKISNRVRRVSPALPGFAESKSLREPLSRKC